MTQTSLIFFANSIVIGVFPLPPTVRFQIDIIGIPKSILEEVTLFIKIIKIYKKLSGKSK